MATTRLSSKGQVILPKSIRDAHRWTSGTEFDVEDHPEGVLLRPRERYPVTELGEVIGCAGYQGPTRSLADMDEAIAQGTAERHARGRY
ncbi:MAG: AbrB/MazE/SpoVT family DNA-binding domain-containing protein [Gammaproteobacteria bacterium]|nr:AbrB/MazE/SpoVT family DNA-binding domain-containing protein [Gammaproteobacteria bacterium]